MLFGLAFFPKHQLLHLSSQQCHASHQKPLASQLFKGLSLQISSLNTGEQSTLDLAPTSQTPVSTGTLVSWGCVAICPWWGKRGHTGRQTYVEALSQDMHTHLKPPPSCFPFLAVVQQSNLHVGFSNRPIIRDSQMSSWSGRDCLPFAVFVLCGFGYWGAEFSLPAE